MFWNKFVELCIKNNTKPNPVAKELGISSGAVTRWKNGSIPNSTTLQLIANYFNVSVDYLKGEENEKTPTKVDEFTELFSKLTDEQKKLVVAQMKGILSDN